MYLLKLRLRPQSRVCSRNDSRVSLSLNVNKRNPKIRYLFCTIVWTGASKSRCLLREQSYCLDSDVLTKPLTFCLVSRVPCAAKLYIGNEWINIFTKRISLLLFPLSNLVEAALYERPVQQWTSSGWLWCTYLLLHTYPVIQLLPLSTPARWSDDLTRTLVLVIFLRTSEVKLSFIVW